MHVRPRRRIPILLLVLGVTLLPGVGMAHTAPSERRAGAIPAGRPRVSPIDAVLVIDDSGSMKTSDPTNERYQAARFAAGMLSALVTPGLDHRVGVVHFGSDAPSQLSLKLTPAGNPAVAAALTPPPALLGNTDFAAALQRAHQILGSAVPGRTQVVLVFTDGEADTGDGRTPAELFVDIASALQALPRDHMHVLGLNADGTFDHDLPRWQRLGLGSVGSVSGLSGGVLELGFGAILAAESGLLTGGEQVLARPGDEAAVDVGPYLEALSLRAFSPDPGTVMGIVDPSGKVVRRVGPGRAGLGEVLFPETGHWRVRLLAGTDAYVAMDQVPIQARLVSPASPAPLGRDLTVEATFVTSEGEPVHPEKSYPLYFGAAVTSPDGGRRFVSLREETPGHYRARDGVPTPQAGTYTVSLEMKGGSQTVLDTVAQIIDVRSLPYLSTGFGTGDAIVRAAQPLQIDAELRVAGRPADAASVLGEDPGAAVVANIRDKRGQLLDAPRLDWDGKSRHFKAVSAYRPAPGQVLTINLTLASMDRSGTAVSDTVALPVVARLSSGMVWRQWVARALAALAAALVLLLMAWCAWLLRRRPMKGQYTVESAGRSQIKTLTGRRLVRIGSGWPRQPVDWIWRTRRGVVSHHGRLPVPLTTREVRRVGPPTRSPLPVPRR